MKIKYWRRISQILFFIIIIYGGFVISQIFSIDVKPIADGTEGRPDLVDAHLPVRTCRYIEPKPALFESCGLKYLLDRPLYSWSLVSTLPILLYILIILSLCFILGRAMCGWMCPLGFFTDLLDYMRQKFRINRITIPDKIKKYLKLWRYSFLLFLIFLSFAIITPIAYGIFMDKNFYALACQVCPARTIIPIFGGKIPLMPSFFTTATAIFSTLSLIFLGIYISGFMITRAWCRICPNGTFTSLFNKGSLITKEKDVRKCTRCGICKRVCPFTNDHVLDEKKASNINHPNCIMCFNCVDKCPENDCLNVSIYGKKIFSSNFEMKK